MRGVRCVEETYNIVQLTDGEAVLPRNYAYWQNINAHRNMDHLLVFVGTDKGPQLYHVSKDTLNVTALGPLFTRGEALQGSTAEGWYWSTLHPHMIYCNDDKNLYRYYVDSGKLSTVASWYIADEALRQWHSSFDENKHSVSLLRIIDYGPWPKVATMVWNENEGNWSFFTAVGALDESQVDKSGRWLLIKEDDNHRVIDLTGVIDAQYMTDAEGAAGHSDSGFNYMVAADNYQQLAAWRLHDFTTGASHVIYETPWDEQVLHVSHCNAVLDAPQKQWVLGSGTCPYLMKIYLDGSGVADKIAPSLTVGTDYDALPKASLDPYGEFAFWIAFDGSRYDAFVTKVS